MAVLTLRPVPSSCQSEPGGTIIVVVMGPLRDKVVGLIRERGPLTFEHFMEMALYDPQYGYYRSDSSRIGREGDFFTSSHLHPAFGATIGRQIEEMWELMGRPEGFTVVEPGPGLGHTCGDMLSYFKDRECFDALNYILVEHNESIRKTQENLLAGFSDKVRWFTSLGEVGTITGCVFSNELIDAFPVHLVVMEDAMREIYVGLDDSGGLRETAGNLSTPALGEYIRDSGLTVSRGYRTEVNLRAREWLHSVNGMLREGFVLTIDYGYNARDFFSEDRKTGTLLCYHGHRLSEDPFEHIGEQDITAHVNFSDLHRWGVKMGLKTTGFTSQGAFLVSLGIHEEIEKMTSAGVDHAAELGRIKRLILPGGMGESHMVMAQYKGEGDPVLRGFSIRNSVRYL